MHKRRATMQENSRKPAEFPFDVIRKSHWQANGAERMVVQCYHYSRPLIRVGQFLQIVQS